MPKASRWYPYIFLGLIVVIFLVIGTASLVATARGNADTAVEIVVGCVDSEENSFSCNDGADYDAEPLPFVQDYTTDEDILRISAEIREGVIDFRGVNLAGGEFGQSPGSTFASEGLALPFDNDAKLFIYKGMNTFRIPITWEYFADPNGIINAKREYLERLDNVIDELVAKNATVIIDLHNYMRYNPGNLSLNSEAGRGTADVIGVGRGVPTLLSVKRLWTAIVNKYRQPSIVYGIMNEPHDVSFDSLVAYTNTAIDAIRNAEAKSSGVRHLILISGNNYSGLHSWVGVNTAFSNSNNALFLGRIRDFSNYFAIEVHQYFDADFSSSGVYAPEGECLDFATFKADFDLYWSRFVGWVKANRVRVFVGEFGVPNTTLCAEVASYFLTTLHSFPYRAETGGIIGWTVWAAGNSWGNYILSVAPGGRANDLMWDNRLYEKFLIPLAGVQIPDISTIPQAIAITNIGSETLVFSSGYVPFQFRRTLDIQAGKTGYMYSNNLTSSTPIDALKVTYTKADKTIFYGFGITKPEPLSNTYSFPPGAPYISKVPKETCPIKASDSTANKGDTRCFSVRL